MKKIIKIKKICKLKKNKKLMLKNFIKGLKNYNNREN